MTYGTAQERRTCTRRKNIEEQKKNGTRKTWKSNSCKPFIGIPINGGEVVKFRTLRDAKRAGFSSYNIFQALKMKKLYDGSPVSNEYAGIDGSTINRTKSDCNQSRGVSLTRSWKGKEKGKRGREYI